MDIISWLTEPAFVNRHVSPLYFIIVIIITTSVLAYAVKTNNKRAVKVFIYAFVVWVILEFGLFFTGIRHYNLDFPYLAILLIGGVEDPGWVCLAYMVAEKMMKLNLFNGQMSNLPAKNRILKEKINNENPIHNKPTQPKSSKSEGQGD